ncbi:MAG: hypothetical protein QGH40_15530 [bacterium]|jgi:hypothetical protein|nr:hypothetical protein [bacterium]
MLVEETFVVYLYGTDGEIELFQSLTRDQDLNSIALLVREIKNRL